MTKKLAINGYGRIGRAVVRALYERGLQDQLQVVAINDLGIAESLVYETRYDSVHGAFPLPVEAGEGGMNITAADGTVQSIRILREAEATALPWQAQDIDLVLECSGKLASRELSAQHL